MIIFIYMLLFFCHPYYETLKNHQTHRRRTKSSWHICLISPGMGMGGKMFRIILGAPMRTKYVFKPKTNFLEMAHTNFFFSIRVTPYQPVFCTKNNKTSNVQKMFVNILYCHKKSQKLTTITTNSQQIVRTEIVLIFNISLKSLPIYRKIRRIRYTH